MRSCLLLRLVLVIPQFLRVHVFKVLPLTGGGVPICHTRLSIKFQECSYLVCNGFLVTERHKRIISKERNFKMLINSQKHSETKCFNKCYDIYLTNYVMGGSWGCQKNIMIWIIHFSGRSRTTWTPTLI